MYFGTLHTFQIDAPRINGVANVVVCVTLLRNEMLSFHPTPHLPPPPPPRGGGRESYRLENSFCLYGVKFLNKQFRTGSNPCPPWIIVGVTYIHITTEKITRKVRAVTNRSSLLPTATTRTLINMLHSSRFVIKLNRNGEFFARSYVFWFLFVREFRGLPSENVLRDAIAARPTEPRVALTHSVVSDTVRLTKSYEDISNKNKRYDTRIVIIFICAWKLHFCIYLNFIYSLKDGCHIITFSVYSCSIHFSPFQM